MVPANMELIRACITTETPQNSQKMIEQQTSEALKSHIIREIMLMS